MDTLTEQTFAEALKEIIQEKSLDEVTVTELIQRLSVSRQIFYYHYNNLYDLLEQIYIADGKQMIGDSRTDDSWEKGILAIFHYIRENKAFVCSTYYSVGRNYLEHFLYGRAYELIKLVLKGKELELTQEKLDFRSHFYKYGLVGFILDWIDSGLQENPQDLVQYICQSLGRL